MRRLVNIFSIALYAVILSSVGFARTGNPQLRDGDLTFEPFTLSAGSQSVACELGRLVVRENRRNANSKLIELAFLRIKSTADKPGFPVVYLDGGPGSSAINIARIPDYFQSFMKLREVGDVILLDQRGVGRSKPNLSRLSTEPLPTDLFVDSEIALRAFRARVKAAADHFRSQGVDLQAYNTRESAGDVDDLRKALGAEKINLVGFSYGTHLGLACIRYYGARLNRVVLIGTEGPDHTDKLPFSSDKSLQHLAEVVARDSELGSKIPDLFGLLKRVLDRLEKDPVTVRINQNSNKPLDVKVGKFGLQFLIMRDLGDTNDLPIFPAWFYSMDRGDWRILARFVEKRYNQFGAGIQLMSVIMDAASGCSKTRRLQIEKEAKTALLGNTVNFPYPGVDEVIDHPDLGDAYRSPIRTTVPTLFFSGNFDNNTPSFQTDEVRRFFKISTHIVIENAGHESMLDNARVQQSMVDYLRGRDVSAVKIALPPLKFLPLPELKNATQ
jgi:pimeloyl-ACP methyl ester carboxylesterase